MYLTPQMLYDDQKRKFTEHVWIKINIITYLTSISKDETENKNKPKVLNLVFIHKTNTHT